ncbi:ArsI/CadI family heavy metal resistance metalloenzyme [Chitinilyticum piscinae]|uniref:VOC family protein n=1 Tax=Chitinilyticum piscinae TaxID=2866724 RepID=A0A8J7FRH5_9NEIS|nr:ArsI/CadI family heavy metal resistance metalloenzyme [Chitinilyticum piscinae]MBE9609531.1 VOC family protein [Chitinilyticum piscinae]
MKRFHVHIAVTDLTRSIDFYSKLFGESPVKVQPDYAKWMLDDPRVNFAISARGHAAGVNHFGMQADTAAELAELQGFADAASSNTALQQGETTCCYARSEKHWVLDPQGLAWEHFLTLSDTPTFGSDSANADGSCCSTLIDPSCAAVPSACCVPLSSANTAQTCCQQE